MVEMWLLSLGMPVMDKSFGGCSFPPNLLALPGAPVYERSLSVYSLYFRIIYMHKPTKVSTMAYTYYPETQLFYINKDRGAKRPPCRLKGRAISEACHHLVLILIPCASSISSSSKLCNFKHSVSRRGYLLDTFRKEPSLVKDLGLVFIVTEEERIAEYP